MIVITALDKGQDLVGASARASFCFTQDDGTCVRNHFCDIFALESDFPDEIKNAKMVEDLTPEQRENFLKSLNVEI